MKRAKVAAGESAPLGALLPKDLSEFKEEKFWDSFFQMRDGEAFEWYGEWADLAGPLLKHCDLKPEQNPRILVPGCGNSALSASMYDAGFLHITNIDFSRVVVAEMLRLHVRARQKMRWLVMDMTRMQFPDESYDFVLDKGGLDALMGDDERPGRLFLSEVGRVLTKGGRFACITLAQKHVIELLLSKFREGWRLSIYLVPPTSGDAAAEVASGKKNVPVSLVPFLVVGRKEGSKKLHAVEASFDASQMDLVPEKQLKPLLEVLEKENKFRTLGSRLFGPDHVSEDIFKTRHPGRRIMVMLGGEGLSKFVYKAWVLDAKPDSSKLAHAAAVFLVPKGRAHEWLFSSEEGHWQVAASAEAGRLILVFLDTKHYPDDLQVIQDDFSPLVRMILPEDRREGNDIPYMTMGDGVANRVVLQEKDSTLTGTMLVEDVEVDEGEKNGNQPSERKFFRRLVFRRNPNLIQSEALLIKTEKSATGKSRRPVHGKKKNKHSKDSAGSTTDFKVDHSYLASPYHAGMIAGLALIADRIDEWLSPHSQMTMMVVGLGAGLLPMFVHNHLPVQKIRIVELDKGVGDLAKRHFGFIESDRMKLEIGDGIAAVKAIERDHLVITDQPAAKELSHDSVIAGLKNLTVGQDRRLHMLLVDADSENPSTGLSCPPPEFLEESFLRAAKSALVEGGILVINVVSRIEAPCVAAVASLKELYEEVYELKIDEDVNRVLFALPQRRAVSEDKDSIMTAASQLKKIATDFAPWQNGPNLDGLLKDLKRLV